MRFELRTDVSNIDKIEYGKKGSELECFIPAEYEWKQLNFGQGEGQVLVDGCEWGFYYTDNNMIGIVLHEGDIDISQASIFIKKVKEKVSKSVSAEIEVVLVGDETSE